MKGKKAVSPVVSFVIIAIVVLVAGFLFWNAAKGKPKRVPGAGRFGDTMGQQQDGGRQGGGGGGRRGGGGRGAGQ